MRHKSLNKAVRVVIIIKKEMNNEKINRILYTQGEIQSVLIQSNLFIFPSVETPESPWIDK